MKHIRKVELDIDREYFEKIPAVQYDNNSRFLHITLMSGVGPLDITGHTVIVSGYKPDGTEIFNSCRVVDAKKGVVEVHLSEQVSAADGVVDANIQVYGDDKSLLSTQQFHIYVAKGFSNRNVESSNEFGGLVDALGKVQEIDNRFDQKRDKSTKLTSSDLDTSSDANKLTMNHLSDEVRKAMTGEAQVSPIIPAKSITTEKYADKSIGVLHTDFTGCGKNLFDPARISPKGWYMQYNDGKPVSNQYVTELCYSGPITVLPGQSYTTNTVIHSYAIFNSQGAFMTGATVGVKNSTILIPAGGATLVINPFHSDASTGKVQVEKGTVPTALEPFEVKIRALKADKVIEEILPDVKTIPKVSGDLSKVRNSLLGNFNCTDSVIGSEFKPFTGWNYTSSTFSGWGSHIGVHNDFDTIGFMVRARAANTSPITKVKVMLLQEEVLLREYTLNVNIPAGTIANLTWTLPYPIKNTSNKPYQFAFQCDKLCDLAEASNIKDPTWSTSRYSTDGNFMSYAAMSKVPDGSGPIPGGGQIVWTRVGVSMYEITTDPEKFKEDLSQFIKPEGFDNSFNLVEGFQVEAGNKNTGEGYNTSSFSGWAGHIGTYASIKALKFQVKNRDTIPTTKIKVFITNFNKDGPILAGKLLKVNIAPGALGTVIWEFDTPFLNPTGKKLYFSYLCNTLITKVQSTLPANSDDVVYGWNCYATGGNISITPRELAKVYGEHGGTSTVWVEIGERVAKYEPTQHFLESVVSTMPALDSIRVVLPKKITCVVNDTLQLFYRGLVEAVNPYNYDIRVICLRGKQFPRYFEFKPTLADVGTYAFKLSVRNNSGKLLAEQSTVLEVVASPNQPASAKNILCVGDSLTSNGVWCEEARRRLCDQGGVPAGLGKTNIKFIGTKGNANGCKWEGYGGWTWNSYLNKPNVTTSDIWVYCSHNKTANDQHSIWQDSSGAKWSLETIEPTKLKFTRYQAHTSAPPTAPGTLTHVQNAVNTTNIAFTDCKVAEGNPFWDFATNKVDFKKYCETNGFSGIDYVYTLLTWNGGRVDKWDVASNTGELEAAKQFIDALHRDYPNAKVRVMGIQLPSLNGGTGANYGATGGYSETYGLVRGVFGLNLTYMQLASDPAYKDFVEFVNVSGGFDSEYNMPYSTALVNTRSTVTETLGTNGVHPSNEGYCQIGDIAYRSLVADLCK